MTITVSREDIEDSKPVVRNHIYADIVDNSAGAYDPEASLTKRLLRIQADNYSPGNHEQWDPEQWEAQQTIILAPAQQKFWVVAWRIARVIARHGKACIVDQGITINVPEIVVLS